MRIFSNNNYRPLILKGSAFWMLFSGDIESCEITDDTNQTSCTKTRIYSSYNKVMFGTWSSTLGRWYDLDVCQFFIVKLNIFFNYF